MTNNQRKAALLAIEKAGATRRIRTADLLITKNHQPTVNLNSKKLQKTSLMTHALGRFYGSVDLVWKHDRNNRLSAKRCGSIGLWQPRQAPYLPSVDTGQCVVDASGFVDVPVCQTVEQLVSAFIRRSIDPLFVFVHCALFLLHMLKRSYDFASPVF